MTCSQIIYSLHIGIGVFVIGGLGQINVRLRFDDVLTQHNFFCLQKSLKLRQTCWAGINCNCNISRIPEVTSTIEGGILPVIDNVER